MLWLFDCRDRLYGRRALIRFPYTFNGKKAAWDYMLKREFATDDERVDYHYLRDDGGGAHMGEYCELFNDYWACYGWCLLPVEPDAEIPNDAEVADDQA